jgi:dipeptidyl aminopeptidase/acylaminoacyl peptidase
MFSASILADGVPLLAIPAQGGAQQELAKTVLAYPDFVVPSPGKTDQLATIVGGYRSIWTNKALHLLSTTGKDVRLTPPEVSASAPDWSPDGQNLAYAAMPDQSDPGPAGVDLPPDKMPYRLFVADAQGKQPPRQITDDPAYRDERPRWSLDGNQLLFVRVDARGRASVWLVPVTGGAPCWVVDGLTQEPGATTYYGDWQRTVFPYYGHMKWDALLDWWRGPSAAKP